MTKDLTSGNPFKIILLFTLPLMLGNLFQQFYSLADTIIVGRFVGVNALAAVGATGSVNYLILGFVIGMCNGFAIPIAQLFGAHDDSDLRRHVANATWLCIAWGVVLTVVTVALTRPIMELMQTPADIIDGASTYIGWIFAGIPFVFLYNMVSAIMRALGDSKTPLYFLVLTSAVNIVLDLVLIMSVEPGFGGQKFIEHSLDKVRELRELITVTGSQALIEVDGGVNLETGSRLVEAGADVLVAGNAVFSAPDPKEAIRALRNL